MKTVELYARVRRAVLVNGTNGAGAIQVVEGGPFLLKIGDGGGVIGSELSFHPEEPLWSSH